MRHPRPTQAEIDAAMMESARAIPPVFQERLDAMLAEAGEDAAAEAPAPSRPPTRPHQGRGRAPSRTYPPEIYTRQIKCAVQRDIYRAARAAALLADVSLSAYVNRALHAQLEKDLHASRVPPLRKEPA